MVRRCWPESWSAVSAAGGCTRPTGGDNKAISYFCDGSYPQSGEDKCQRVAARSVDRLVTGQVLRAVEPASLQLSLQAAERLRNERQRLHEHWRQQLERATFLAERAKRQYDAVE